MSEHGVFVGVGEGDTFVLKWSAWWACAEEREAANDRYFGGGELFQVHGVAIVPTDYRTATTQAAHEVRVQVLEGVLRD
jgi:hypothetical protein